MKSTFVLFSLSFISFFSIAQDVKIKKDIVYVDEKDYLKIDDEFGNETILNLKDEELFTLKSYSFEKPNPARNNMNDPARHNYPATTRVHYFVVSFVKFNLEFETDLTKKKLFLACYKYKLLNDDGSVNEENAKKIAAKVSKEMSGDRPLIIINN